MQINIHICTYKYTLKSQEIHSHWEMICKCEIGNNYKTHRNKQSIKYQR